MADQPHVVEHAISDFTTSLWQAIAIIMAVSFVSLGVRAGLVVAISIPLTLAIVFPIMQLAGIDLQRISLGALIIALGLLVDDAMTTIDVMTSRLAAGDTKEQSATYAYTSVAIAMLTGSFVTAAGFVPIGFAKSSAGEYTFSIFVVVGVSLIVSWIVAVLFAPLLGVWLLKPPKTAAKPSRILGGFRSMVVGAMRAKWITIGVTAGCFVVALAAVAADPAAVLPAVRPAGIAGRSAAAAERLDLRHRRHCAERLSEVLAKDPDVASWSTYVGRGAIRFYLPLAVELPNDFFTQAVVIAKDVAARKRLQDHLEKVLGQRVPLRHFPRLAAWSWAAGRLADAVSRQRPGYFAGARYRVAPGRRRRPAIRTRRM